MAKAITRDRYRIHAETSLEEMGVVLAALTRMGLQNIGYELVTDVRSFGNNKTHETSAEQEITEYIKEHPTFAIADVVALLKKQGRTGGAIYTAARLLVDKGALKRLDKGNYQRADVKAIAAPKQVTKTYRLAGVSPKRFDIKRSAPVPRSQTSA